MKTLEIRRHSLRKSGGGGSQLSQEGVAFARRLGSALGPFALVATSVAPRARETAIAMGFAVDHELVTLASDEAIYAEAEAARWWETPRPFVAIAGLLGRQGATWRYAHAMVAVWRDLLNGLPDGANALVIGHSGELELGLVACFPRADHAAWGTSFGPCQGARLTFAGDPARFTTLSLLRDQRDEHTGRTE